MLTGLILFAAFGLYGQGAALMGDMGPVIGWAIYVGLGMMVGTVWAVLAGEWKGVPGPLKIMLGSIALLVVAVLYPGLFQPFDLRARRTALRKILTLLLLEQGTARWNVVKS